LNPLIVARTLPGWIAKGRPARKRRTGGYTAEDLRMLGNQPDTEAPGDGEASVIEASFAVEGAAATSTNCEPSRPLVVSPVPNTGSHSPCSPWDELCRLANTTRGSA